MSSVDVSETMQPSIFTASNDVVSIGSYDSSEFFRPLNYYSTELPTFLNRYHEKGSGGSNSKTLLTDAPILWLKTLQS